MKALELSKLNNLLYFTADSLSAISQNDSPKTIDTNIRTWLKNGTIIRLRRGYYITQEMYIRYKSYAEYPEFLACVMKYPSYLTAEYVMRKYDMLTEATYGYTLATLKSPMSINNKLGNFSYKRIQKGLFLGYEVKNFLGSDYFEAKKSKALFDFLYYRSRLIPNDLRKINLVEDLRLNLDSMEGKDFDMLKDFSLILNKPKIIKITNNIIKHASNYS